MSALENPFGRHAGQLEALAAALEAATASRERAVLCSTAADIVRATVQTSASESTLCNIFKCAEAKVDSESAADYAILACAVVQTLRSLDVRTCAVRVLLQCGNADAAWEAIARDIHRWTPTLCAYALGGDIPDTVKTLLVQRLAGLIRPAVRPSPALASVLEALAAVSAPGTLPPLPPSIVSLPIGSVAKRAWQFLSHENVMCVIHKALYSSSDRAAALATEAARRGVLAFGLARSACEDACTHDLLAPRAAVSALGAASTYNRASFSINDILETLSTLRKVALLATRAHVGTAPELLDEPGLETAKTAASSCLALSAWMRNVAQKHVRTNMKAIKRSSACTVEKKSSEDHMDASIAATVECAASITAATLHRDVAHAAAEILGAAACITRAVTLPTTNRALRSMTEDAIAVMSSHTGTLPAGLERAAAALGADLSVPRSAASPLERAWSVQRDALAAVVAEGSFEFTEDALRAAELAPASKAADFLTVTLRRMPCHALRIRAFAIDLLADRSLSTAQHAGLATAVVLSCPGFSPPRQLGVSHRSLPECSSHSQRRAATFSTASLEGTLRWEGGGEQCSAWARCATSVRESSACRWAWPHARVSRPRATQHGRPAADDSAVRASRRLPEEIFVALFHSTDKPGGMSKNRECGVAAARALCDDELVDAAPSQRARSLTRPDADAEVEDAKPSSAKSRRSKRGALERKRAAVALDRAIPGGFARLAAVSRIAMLVASAQCAPAHDASPAEQVLCEACFSAAFSPIASLRALGAAEAARWIHVDRISRVLGALCPSIGGFHGCNAADGAARIATCLLQRAREKGNDTAAEARQVVAAVQRWSPRARVVLAPAFEPMLREMASIVPICIPSGVPNALHAACASLRGECQGARSREDTYGSSDGETEAPGGYAVRKPSVPPPCADSVAAQSTHSPTSIKTIVDFRMQWIDWNVDVIEKLAHDLCAGSRKGSNAENRSLWASQVVAICTFDHGRDIVAMHLPEIVGGPRQRHEEFWNIIVSLARTGALSASQCRRSANLTRLAREVRSVTRPRAGSGLHPTMPQMAQLQWPDISVTDRMLDTIDVRWTVWCCRALVFLARAINDALVFEELALPARGRTDMRIPRALRQAEESETTGPSEGGFDFVQELRSSWKAAVDAIPQELLAPDAL